MKTRLVVFRHSIRYLFLRSRGRCKRTLSGLSFLLFFFLCVLRALAVQFFFSAKGYALNALNDINDPNDINAFLVPVPATVKAIITGL